MKILNTALPMLLVAFLAFGVFQLAMPAGGDDAVTRESTLGFAENMRVLADTASARTEIRTASQDPITVSSAPVNQHDALNADLSHDPAPPFADAPMGGSDENGGELQIEVSVAMADGSMQTFAGTGVMFTLNGKAMQIPEGGYRVLSDGTFMPDADLDARTESVAGSP